MLRACKVPQCPTRKSYRSLHYLPTKENYKIQWINALSLNNKKLPTNFQICSSHFKATDFLPSLSDQIRLKKGAVPSQNLPKSSTISNKLSAVEKLPKARQNIFVVDKTKSNKQNQSNNNELEDSSLRKDEEITNTSVPLTYVMQDGTENVMKDVTNAIDDLLLNMEIIDDKDSEEELTLDENENLLAMEKNTLQIYAATCIQVNTLDDFKFSDTGFMGMLSTDGDLNSFTGLTNFDLLNRIIVCMKCEASIQPDLRKLEVPLDVAIVLVFTKIKTNLTFKQCGVLFKLHPQTVSKIFSDILPLVRAVLSVAVFWSTKESNSRTYSHYKGKHILKFRITINRFGLITHTSSTYDGKDTDKNIFLNEEILDKCEKVALMVDKGYAIADEVSAKGVDELIRPPIFDTPEISPHDSISNTSIALARAHVERSIQRVKSFKIFQEKIPHHMLRHIDDIVVLVCAIVNLTSPILSEITF